MKFLPQSRLSWFGDICMVPIMYLLQGTLREVPQRTHFWNNVKFPVSDFSYLESEAMVTIAGDPQAVRRFWGPLPIFHMPIFGGWSKFVVIEPAGEITTGWHIGWIAGDVAGVSQIELKSGVRVLIGSGPTQFFGVTPQGEQRALRVVGHGRVRHSGQFARVPLL